MVECVTGDSSRREEDIPEGVEEDEDDFVIEIPLIAAAFPGYGLIGLSTGIRRGKLQQHRSHIHVNVNTSICVCVYVCTQSCIQINHKGKHRPKQFAYNHHTRKINLMSRIFPRKYLKMSRALGLLKAVHGHYW